MGEERGGTGNWVNQGEVPLPIGLHKTDEVKGFEKSRGDDETPKLVGGMDEKRGENPEADEEREIEKNPP